jgi:hypothetical protein
MLWFALPLRRLQTSIQGNEYTTKLKPLKDRLNYYEVILLIYWIQ